MVAQEQVQVQVQVGTGDSWKVDSLGEQWKNQLRDRGEVRIVTGIITAEAGRNYDLRGPWLAGKR